ncbi:MAG: thioesterase family protein [Planctomycetota bacterium]
MSQVFHHARRVEFRDTDMAGIVHFSVFFTYMEEAEHAFLRSTGLGVFMDHDNRKISWPRVAADCNYRSAIRFEDDLDIQVSIQRLGTKSITFCHQMFLDDRKVADGQITTVCCEMVPHAKPESIEIPRFVIDALKPYQQIQPE